MGVQHSMVTYKKVLNLVALAVFCGLVLRLKAGETSSSARWVELQKRVIRVGKYVVPTLVVGLCIWRFGCRKKKKKFEPLKALPLSLSDLKLTRYPKRKNKNNKDEDWVGSETGSLKEHLIVAKENKRKNVEFCRRFITQPLEKKSRKAGRPASIGFASPLEQIRVFWGPLFAWPPPVPPTRTCGGSAAAVAAAALPLPDSPRRKEQQVPPPSSAKPPELEPSHARTEPNPAEKSPPK
jgi:hypothetical protein